MKAHSYCIDEGMLFCHPLGDRYTTGLLLHGMVTVVIMQFVFQSRKSSA